MAKRAAQRSLRAGKLSDAFWEKVEPLLPEFRRELAENYVRKPGGGRKPNDARLVFEGIVFVLRNGCRWKALPAERYGSSTVIHRRFLEWQEAGVFEALWKAKLAEHEELEGIPWRWRSNYGTTRKAPRARKAVELDPTKEVKKIKRRSWRPAVDSRDRNKATRPDPAPPLIAEDCGR